MPTLVFALFMAEAAWADVASAGVPRPSTGAPGSLSLDGLPAGGVGNVVVPSPRSDVVIADKGADFFSKKHIGNVHYPEIGFTIGADASKSVTDWVASSLRMTHLRKNGTVAVGSTGHDFFNALVSEVVFPALEASSAARAAISVSVSPEYTRATAKRSGEIKPAARGAGLSSSLFGVTLSGLDTGNVVRVDSFSAKHTIVENPIGVLRDYEKEPGKLEFSNISLYVRPADATSFVTWHNDFVVNGNCGDEHEKTGSIDYYSEDQRHIFSVQLAGVGISSIREFMIDDLVVLKIDLYVERMELVHQSRGEGAAAPSKKAKKAKAARMPAPRRKTVSERKPIPGKPSSGKVPRE